MKIKILLLALISLAVAGCSTSRVYRVSSRDVPLQQRAQFERDYFRQADKTLALLKRSSRARAVLTSPTATQKQKKNALAEMSRIQRESFKVKIGTYQLINKYGKYGRIERR